MYRSGRKKIAHRAYMKAHHHAHCVIILIQYSCEMLWKFIFFFKFFSFKCNFQYPYLKLWKNLLTSTTHDRQLISVLRTFHRGSFRPLFKELGRLRSTLINANILLLSATMTEYILNDILHHLHLQKQNIGIVWENIDR